MNVWARRAGAERLSTLIVAILIAAASVMAAPTAALPDSADPPDAAAGDSLEGLPIGRIDILPRNIFDPVPAGRIAPLFRIANRLHVRTRPSTLREQLLFARGEPWGEERRRETERNLRGLDFVVPDRIRARREGDSVSVAVVTHDVWSTSPEFNLESTGAHRYGSIGFTERNLLGLGKSLSLFYHDEPTGNSHSISLDDPSLLSSRARLHYVASNGTAGALDQVSVALPFYAEDTPTSYGFSWFRSTYEGHLYQRSVEVARFDERFEDTEVFFGKGRKIDGTVQRWLGSFLARDRRIGPSTVSADAPPEFIGDEDRLRLRRLSLEGSWWRPRFIERTMVNRMGGIEDFDLGPSISLKLGGAPEALGSTTSEGYFRLIANAGAETRGGFGWIRASGSSRVRRDLEDVLVSMDGRWFVQPTRRALLALAGTGALGARPMRDFEFVIGGLSGLRAYPIQAVAGRQIARFNVEQRWIVAGGLWQSLVVGAVGFGDAARAWGPGSAGDGWFYAAGVGLRLAFPQWSPNHVLRADVAWPVQPHEGRPVLSLGSSQAF